MFRIRGGVSDDVKDVVTTVADQASTNAYADIIGAYFVGDSIKVLIFIGESGGVNGVTFKISGSSLGATWTVLKTDIVAASGNTYETLTDAWRYLKVEVIDTVAASHGTAFASLHKVRQ